MRFINVVGSRGRMIPRLVNEEPARLTRWNEAEKQKNPK